jgi:Zn-dependent protease
MVMGYIRLWNNTLSTQGGVYVLRILRILRMMSKYQGFFFFFSMLPLSQLDGMVSVRQTGLVKKEKGSFKISTGRET